MKDSGGERNVDYDAPAQVISKEKSIKKWPIDCFCDILVKNVAPSHFSQTICLMLN